MPTSMPGRLAALALLASLASAALGGPPRPAATVVLVHGALIDGSSWRGVHDRLVRDGYRVRVVQQPLSGFEADVAATQRVLDQEQAPIVLVGHSYGGAIITMAGQDAKVKALVYVAALQPDVGETAAEAAPPQPDAGKHLRAAPDGLVDLDPAAFAQDFGADLPRAQAEFMAHAQMPIAAAAFNVRLSAAAWHDKPSYAIVATQDRALAREDALRMARRAGSHITLVKASHAVLVSQPGAVARVIEQAAAGLR